MSNPDLQVNAITTMCNMTHLITLPTHVNLITVTEIVHQSSCKGIRKHARFLSSSTVFGRIIM